MTSFERNAVLRRALLGATSLVAAAAATAPAHANDSISSAPDASIAPGTAADLLEEEDHQPFIIVTDNLSPTAPAPGGALDQSGKTIGLVTGVNGVGQMFVRGNPNTTGLSLCTGTLINPRTVIFAAHCVNTRPTGAYGPNGSPFGLHAGGTPIAFGFAADNLPGVRQWLGLASVAGGTDANPALRHATNEQRALYNVEQVWYDPRSLATGFLEADVAIATLDTPAFQVPTWTLLFSPLTEGTHSTIIGYGTNGTHSSAQGTGCPAPFNACSPIGSIDFRRRAAENMLDVLGSLADRSNYLFGSASALQQSLYMQDFDSPGGRAAFNPSAGRFDFDLAQGGALAREGITAGGDSGGPLVVDQKFTNADGSFRPVVVGVLSGGSRFYNGQRFSTYGTSNFYQPLFLFWDAIVANNNYIYAGAKAGDGAWEDASRWVQLMDPNYAVERNGVLVNDLPDTPALGVSGNTPKFGTLCSFDLAKACTDLADDDTATAPAAGSGAGLIVPGGPGSTDFVPNNVKANPSQGVRARYYDVTLSQLGTTSLSSDVTIDKLTIDGPSKLDVKSAGSLRVLGDFEQWQGWVHVDGTLRANEALIATGFLSGSGTLRAPFVTVGKAVVAPGGVDNLGTLTIDGNLIMTSASALFVDAGRVGADQLSVTGILSLSDGTNPGASLVMNKAKGAAPRHGDSFTIANAGSIQGTFGAIYSFQGVLRPELTYSETSIVANLRAGSLAQQIGQSGPIERAFATALDQLRSSSYNSLYGLYGSVDLMDGRTLARTLNGLAPAAVTSETLSLQDKQSKVMLDTISNRLSSLGTSGTRGTLSIVGSPEALIALTGSPNGLGASLSRFGASQNLVSGQRSVGALPQNVSGFISGGISTRGSTFGNDSRELAGQRSWNVGMGLEVEMSDRFTLGTAFGYADGYAAPGGEQARIDTRVSQAAVYGSYRVGKTGYVAGIAAAERSRAGIDRQVATGDATFALTGATETARYSAMAEAGVNLAVARGLTLTPRAQLGYSSYQLSGFRENGGEVALQLDDVKLQRLEAKVGAKFAGSAALGKGWSFAPQLQADWVQNLSGSRDGMTVRFANAPGAVIALPLAAGDVSWAEVKGGMRLTNGKLELGAGIESSFGRSDLRDERAVADFTLRF
jgi:subtilase-type serine protease